MPTPTNTRLYNQVVADAKTRFKRWPSAYASGWVVARYKKLGGTYKNENSAPDKHLARWFREKWVNVCELPKIVPCGRKEAAWDKNYPYCRPMVRVTKSTPKTVGELTKEELSSRCVKKRSNPTEVLRSYKNKS